MSATTKPAPQEIERAWRENAAMRERDLAQKLGISEAELVAARCGGDVTRLNVDVGLLLKEFQGLGEVMALTRNESAVHEKIGVYENVTAGEKTAIVLGSEIDLRIFPRVWKHGFAVEKRLDGDVRRSLQFFDAAGEAVHKIHLRPKSNLYAYQKLVSDLAAVDQGKELAMTAPSAAVEAEASAPVDIASLREHWQAMKDVHQFANLLRTMKLTRRRALALVGDDHAWPIDRDAVSAMMSHVANDGLPIMCFVGNRGCIQIHGGAIEKLKPMGPWMNVMDETFHLHLRMDHLKEVWAVRKPTREGHVTSIEAFDADGNLVIQFFGKRHEGEDERSDWRFLAENLPRLPRTSAA